MVVFFAGGTGHPYFSTDTGIVLRAIELDADAILLAKAIDGIYDKMCIRDSGYIEYKFNTELKPTPKMNDDGTVDFQDVYKRQVMLKVMKQLH